MLKYFTLLLVFTLFQGNIQAEPLNIFEKYILNFIENHVAGLDKHKAEIEDILSEVLQHEKEHAQINDDLDKMKNEMVLASQKGDKCAKQVLTMLAADPLPPCPTVDDLVQAAGKIVSSTTEIITGSVHSFYVIFANNKTCDGISEFRCFLAQFHKVQTTLFSVLDNLVDYKNTAVKLVNVYKAYFGRCKQAKSVNMKKHMLFYSTCTGINQNNVKNNNNHL